MFTVLSSAYTFRIQQRMVDAHVAGLGFNHC